MNDQEVAILKRIDANAELAVEQGRSNGTQIATLSTKFDALDGRVSQLEQEREAGVNQAMAVDAGAGVSATVIVEQARRPSDSITNESNTASIRALKMETTEVQTPMISDNLATARANLEVSQAISGKVADASKDQRKTILMLILLSALGLADRVMAHVDQAEAQRHTTQASPLK